MPSFGGTGWDSTARFHVWPWPFRVAVILNFPAFVGSWPIAALIPNAGNEFVSAVPALLLVPVLWYGVGGRMERWHPRRRGVFLASLFGVSLLGALVPGYTSFLPIGALVWAAAFWRIWTWR